MSIVRESPYSTLLVDELDDLRSQSVIVGEIRMVITAGQLKLRNVYRGSSSRGSARNRLRRPPL
jgi:hypothetical protein